MDKTFIGKLEKARENKSFVMLDREIGVSPLLCVPLVISEKLLLIQVAHDFHLEGYRVVRLEDIEGIGIGETEKFFERIFKKEKIYDDISLPNWELGDDMAEMLKNLQRNDEVFIIECENDNDDVVYVGKIGNIDENSGELSFLTLDVLGKWDSDLLEISLDSITSISQNEYSIMYGKYAI